jgi:hypothetical protein
MELSTIIRRLQEGFGRLLVTSGEYEAKALTF